LHTIQDFYSHSNWVEMGKTEPNLKIGTNDFLTMASVSPNDTDICNDTCTLLIEQCGFFTNLLTQLIKFIGLTPDTSCPLK
jgi:hypothetical protein